MAIWIYGGVTKLMEEEVQPLLVPAIIEHEGIGCITGGKIYVFIPSFSFISFAKLL